ncbi:MAG: hypothetical protein CL678_11785 [Bdellovibrionaceae bacterium]|nr:hypothetical protein [Pseudobdellovibrionaceae bacterium]
MLALVAVVAAQAFGTHYDIPIWTVPIFCHSQTTLLQRETDCQYGCSDVMPTTEQCAYHLCQLKNNPTSVDMVIDDYNVSGLNVTTINNQHPEFCGCWLGTNTQDSAFEAMSIREVNNNACPYDASIPWNSNLFDTTYPNHTMNTDVTRLCTCAPPPTTTTTVTTTTTLRSCEDITTYYWPSPFFVSQTGCLLQIYRDSVTADPWPAALQHWYVNQGDSNATARLQGRVGSSATAVLTHDLQLIFSPANKDPIQLARVTSAPTQAPTPPSVHVCGKNEVGLYLDGEQTAKLLCNQWQPSYCRHRPNKAQCPCYCGVPAPEHVKKETERILEYTLVGANSAIFAISVIMLFRKL